MIDSVLVPYDGSQQATDALSFAVEEFDPQRLHVLYVINPIETGYHSDTGGDIDDRILAAARHHLEGTDSNVTMAVESGRPDREIVAYAGAHDIDVIVMGSHGRNRIARILLGSVAETVVRRAPTPVCIVR